MTSSFACFFLVFFWLVLAANSEKYFTCVLQIYYAMMNSNKFDELVRDNL